MSPVTVQRLQSIPQAESLRAQWNAWAPTPMQTPEWMFSWWEAFGSPNSQLAVLDVRDATRSIGIVPLMIRHSWSFGRTLRFLGSGAACSDYQTILTSPDQAETAVDAVADWLTSGEGRQAWDVLELEGISDQCPKMQRLLQRLQGGQVTLQTTQLENTWRLDLSSGWDGYYTALSKTQRSQTRNLMNRFDKNADMQLQRVSDPEKIHGALKVSIDLHQQRWQASGRSGCFADQRFTKFMSGAIPALAAQGRAEFAILEWEGRAVASQFILKDPAGNIFIYQSGRDPALDKAKVGRIINAILIREACAAGAQFIDYLRGNEIYKSRLRAAPIGCSRVRVFAPRALPKLRLAAWKLSHGIKHRSQTLARRLRGAAAPAATCAEE